MTQATYKAGSASKNSVAFQYLREQVARQMASVYTAFDPLVEKKMGSSQQNTLHPTVKSKG